MHGKPSTRRDYVRRMASVARYIAEHLDEELALERLAGVACFSPYHFHRIYRAMLGETAAETVRRLRLHRAAMALLGGAEPIKLVAKRAGYGSTAAFSRSFTANYGLPPLAFRQRGLALGPSSRRSERETTIMFDVTIENLPSLRLAAIRHTGPYMEIGKTFDRICDWAQTRGLMGADTLSVGVFYDDPASVQAGALRSDAGVTVPESVRGDGDVGIVTLAAGRHAVLRYKGPYHELHSAYDWLYCEWLPASGEEPADRPSYEIYRNSPQEVPPPDLITDICLPLAR
ncbi:AraC family transcriptional regulator [Chelatococcus sp. SYSU_G07232]|uniref:AraC family transcriptional regulator n=1 Tax=Chelatococcus albus TaxID=3047466 RepID=A0ABT7AGK0_9HYPH|nr:AraC family transcriptional regulator [Chelatococcus sp. SYSU_G07232]MDJ1158491.1 AraC family transcriptional regulator [Chelatococcus sp. SYSU_G07232]